MSDRSHHVAAFVMGLVVAGPVAQAAACPYPGQTPMLVTQLFFGQSIDGGGHVTPEQWRAYLADTVTPAFPDGFTVYDAYGQFLDTSTNKPGREDTKVVVIAAPHGSGAVARVTRITNVYVRRFHQQSVGVVSNTACAGF